MKRILKMGSDYYISNPSETVTTLPVAVYKIEENAMTGEVFIQHQYDKFDFTHKIYEMEVDFIERVALTYKETTGNLGVLMNGTRGTGKSVTSKLIANKLNLPVIIINKNFGEKFVLKLKDFISELPCDAVILFDEFEKVFPDEGWGKTPTLLTLMDGVDNSPYRRVFLMTTNELHLNQNYLERPSRIRYIKTYTDLKLDTIYEIVDDILTRPEFRDDCVEFISKLNIITIDIVKTIINEVNIHNQPPEAFKEFFNIKTTSMVYEVFEVVDGQKVLYSNSVDASDISVKLPFTPKHNGNYFSIFNRDMGEIISVKDENTVIVKDEDNDNAIKTFNFVGREKKHKAFVF